MPRKINVTTKANKPAKPGKPAATKAVPVVKPAAATATPKAAKPVRGVAATARTIVAGATNFGGLSDRDTAYLAFYAGIAKRNNGTVNIEALATSDARPATSGSSNKPHDAGVIVRLTKAALLTPSTDGRTFTFTKLAHTHAAYTTAK